MKEVIKDYSRRKAYYKSIPCYFNPINNELKGRNIIYDFLLNITLWFEVTEALPITLAIWNSLTSSVPGMNLVEITKLEDVVE